MPSCRSVPSWPVATTSGLPDRPTSSRPKPDFDPLPFDTAAARAFGRVAASLRRAGRKTSARAYDAMIAATAMANDLAVYTCNPGDFEGIEGLDVIQLPHPDTAPDEERVRR